MNTRRELIAQSMARILGQLDIKDLGKIHGAQIHAWEASAHLGQSEQFRAQNVAWTLIAEVFQALPDYNIDRIESELKSTARDLEVAK